MTAMPRFPSTEERAEPRRFMLIRHEDKSGISGVGVVAYGVQFHDGACVTRWNSAITQTCFWSSVEEIKAVHGHKGATEIKWLDDVRVSNPEQLVAYLETIKPYVVARLGVGNGGKLTTRRAWVERVFSQIVEVLK